MQAALEHTDQRIFAGTRSGLIVALCIGLGAVLGVLGTQLWSTSTHAVTLQVLAPVAAALASMDITLEAQ